MAALTLIDDNSQVMAGRAGVVPARSSPREDPDGQLACGRRLVVGEPVDLRTLASAAPRKLYGHAQDAGRPTMEISGEGWRCG
jgi:hypothetical protein